MNAALRRRIAQLERYRPKIEAEEAEERARFEVDSLIAAWPLSATGELLPLWQFREIFGEDFLVDPPVRIRRAAMLEGNDDVHRRYTWHLNNPALFDFWPLVALTRALLEHYVNRASLEGTEGVDGSLQKAISLAEKLVTVMERVADSERHIGPVRRAEVDRFLNAVSVVLATHLEPAQLPAAQRQLQELLRRDEKHPMGRLHEFERPHAAPSGAEGANGAGDATRAE